jgi:peptidoglycan/LPS O-acetylase OafA/YrhL
VRRFVAGDPLRGLACLAVIAVHTANGAVWSTGYASGPHPLNYLDAFGQPVDFVLQRLPTAVFVFFALSGYLIARPFVRAFILDRPRPPIPAYLLRRALRILPLLWVTLALILIVIPQERAIPVTDVIGRLTLVSTFSHGPLAGVFGQAWSLRTEAGFYLGLPLAALAAQRLAAARLGERGRRRFVLTGCAVVSAGSLALAGLGPESHIDYIRAPHVLAFAFCPGVALAALECDSGWRPVKSGSTALALIVIALGAIALNGSAPHLWMSFALSGLGCGLLVAVPLLREREGARGPVERLFESAPLQWLGSRSYPIFLAHMAVMAELYPIVRHMSGYKTAYAALLPLTMVTTFAVAEVLHRAMERPFLRYRERRRSSPAALDAPAPIAAAVQP